MDIDVDHYKVLGLSSGEEGSKLTDKEISKAYKLKALELHPDKRPDDPNAHANFQKLKLSYEILKDEKARKLFDDLLRAKREKDIRLSQHGAKRRKMMSELNEKERAASAPDEDSVAKAAEERTYREFLEQVARVRAMHAKWAPAPTVPASMQETTGMKKESMSSTDKEKILKVSWEKVAGDYTAERLREVFLKFGEVEDVVIKTSKKRGSALVVMATKDAAVAATGSVSGDLSNPLFVEPVQRAVATKFPSAQESTESDHFNNVAGAGYKEYEDRILEKLQKAAAAKNQK